MTRILVILTTLFTLHFSQASFAQLSQEELRKILAPRIAGLLVLAKNGMLLSSVRAQNQKGMSLEQIQTIDEEWKSGSSPLIDQLQQNKAGSFLKNIIVQQADVYSEVFLTDAQGANVAVFPATSDYWQGDEDKFTQSFANGKGEVFIGDVEYDESSKTNAVQISVPMMYNNKAIGVMVIGVKVSVLEAEKLKGQ